MKKLGSLLCALVLCLSLVPAHAAETPAFPDIDLTTEVGKAAQKMAAAGILNGRDDGTFSENAQLTRGEFVKIVNLTFGLRLTDEATPDFLDVSAGHWAYGQVKIARKAGYIQGNGGNFFLPAGLVTRQEVCVMVGRVQNFQNLTGLPVPIADEVAPWAKESVENAIACGLFQLPADGVFRGTQPITRGEMCLALAQYVTASSGPGSGTIKPEEPTVPPVDPDAGLTEEQKEEKRVAGYIEKMVDSYNSLESELEQGSYTTRVKDSMALLMDCMQRALDARASGTFLTPAYIEKTFASEIKSFKSTYGKLTTQEENDIKTIVARLAYADEIEAVMQYFGISLTV